MNFKIFWYIRNIMLKIKFNIGKLWLLLLEKIDYMKSDNPLSWQVIKTLFFKIVKAIIVILITWHIDYVILTKLKTEAFDNELLLSVVIGGLGVAGVMLGLYCSNIASIYTSNYAHAPREISNLYQKDIITNSCIKNIIEYSLFCMLMIFACILDLNLYYASTILFLYFTAKMIVAFSVSRNRTFQLANTFYIANPVYRDIWKTLKKATIKRHLYKNPSFQDYFRRKVKKDIDVLKIIAKYNEGNPEHHSKAMCDFMISNLQLLFKYFSLKHNIDYDSYWFSEKDEFKQWHLSGYTEISTYVHSGTQLPPKKIKDYLWFEESIQEVNDSCLETLLKNNDFSNVYSYVFCATVFPKETIKSTSAINFWISYLDSLKSKTTPMMLNKDSVLKDENGIALTDVLVSMYYSVAMEICLYIKTFDVEKTINNSLAFSKFSDIDFNSHFFLNNALIKEFYKKIQTELVLERKRITPNWIIEQIISCYVIRHLNDLCEILDSCYEQIIKTGELLFEAEKYYESALAFSRLSELDMKLNANNLEYVYQALDEYLSNKKKDDSVIWESPKFNLFFTKKRDYSLKIIDYLKKCSGYLYLDKPQFLNLSYPDIIGYSYNTLCERLITYLESDDFEMFKTSYTGFLGNSMLYQGYIRTDVINSKNSYSETGKIVAISSPMIEYSLISGLAILWGEFIGDSKWKKLIEDEIDNTFKDKKKQEEVFYNTLQLYAYNQQIFGITDRSILETNWEMRISRAIRTSPSFEIEYGMFGREIVKNHSALFNAFCGHRMVDIGISDVEEVFFVSCVNPRLPEDKKFHSRFKWEDKLDDK